MNSAVKLSGWGAEEAKDCITFVISCARSSALAILGILIGVTAVIWLVAMGEGVSYQAQQQIKELGANNIIVRNVKPSQESSTGRGGFTFIEYGLLRDDFKRIVATIPTVRQAIPMREVSKEARYLDRATDIRLVAAATSIASEMASMPLRSCCSRIASTSGE